MSDGLSVSAVDPIFTALADSKGIVVEIGSMVEMRYQDDEVVGFTIHRSRDARRNIGSVKSPIVQAILGARIGEIRLVRVGRQAYNVQVIDIYPA